MCIGRGEKRGVLLLCPDRERDCSFGFSTVTFQRGGAWLFDGSNHHTSFLGEMLIIGELPTNPLHLPAIEVVIADTQLLPAYK